MSWIRIDDNAPSHRKLLKVPPAARWLWVCGLAYCQRLKTDGHVPLETLATFAIEKPKPLADALVAVGLWHAEPTGYRVHDYLDFNASADERDDKTGAKTERQRRWRDKKRRLQASMVDAPTASTRDAAPLHSTPTPRESAHSLAETQAPEPVQDAPSTPPTPQPGAPLRRRGYADPHGQRLDPSAAAYAFVSETQRIAIPGGWWERTRNDRGLAFDDVEAFAKWLAVEVRNGLAIGANKFQWLDEQVARWLTARRNAAASDAAARRTEAFITEQAEHAARRATPAEVLEGIRAGRASR